MEQALQIQHQILALLGDHPWAGLLHVTDTADSTNTQLKLLADAGAPEGTCLMALEQTSGRGRQGRSFSSPKGHGLYLSLLLRPDCPPEQAGLITPMVAVATCDAIEQTSHVRPQVKWVNDLVLGGKKLAGILAEMDGNWVSNTLNYVIVGIGINLNQLDFPQELSTIATSLRLETGEKTELPQLAAQLIRSLHGMSLDINSRNRAWLPRYRRDCVTLGREVRIIRGPHSETAFAQSIDENGQLIVRYPDGRIEPVASGEVSVRGLWGYT